MEMSERDRTILEHMVSYCTDIEEAAARFGNSYAAFSSDKEYRNACAMCILQIGELSGHLGAEFRAAHREIPWNAVRGMRNVMAHQYGSISVETVWESMERDIPALKAFCVQCLEGG